MSRTQENCLKMTLEQAINKLVAEGIRETVKGMAGGAPVTGE